MVERGVMVKFVVRKESDTGGRWEVGIALPVWHPPPHWVG
jgi:hypothetical protein